MIIAFLLVVAALTYTFRIRPALDERQIAAEMRHEKAMSSAA